MKSTTMMVAVGLLVAACGGPTLDGTYTDGTGLTSYRFTSGGKVYVSAMGTETELNYELDGDKVRIGVPQGGNVILTLLDDGSLSDPMGVKLSRASTETRTATAAPRGASAPRMSGTDRDAAAFVRAKLDSHWVKSADGWTTQLQERNVAGEVVPDYGITPNPLYKQYRELTFTVEPEAVTEAQRLNGTDYRGRVSFRKTPLRFYRTEYDGEGPKGWSDWTNNVLYNLVPTLAVERRNGRWLIQNSDLFDGLKPNATSISRTM